MIKSWIWGKKGREKLFAQRVFRGRCSNRGIPRGVARGRYGDYKEGRSGRPKWQLRGREPASAVQRGDVVETSFPECNFPHPSPYLSARDTATTNDPTNFVNFASVRQVGRDPPLSTPRNNLEAFVHGLARPKFRPRIFPPRACLSLLMHDQCSTLQLW